MSSYANPQNLNRYSYVNNFPLNYTDPDGHRACDDVDSCGNCITVPGGGPGGFGGVSTSKGSNGAPGANKVVVSLKTALKQDANGCHTNSDGVIDIPCRNAPKKTIGSSYPCPATYTYTECFYDHKLLDMGSTPVNLDSRQMQDLALAIYYDLQGRSDAELLRIKVGYDTPFYNGGRAVGLVYKTPEPGFQPLAGIGCGSTTCYSRSEINYFAQGMISAARGEKLWFGELFVVWWKLPKLHTPSAGTLDWFEAGHYYYQYLEVNDSPGFEFAAAP